MMEASLSMGEIQVLSLTRGQDIMSVLYEFLKDKHWPGALIVSGIGSVSSITIGNPLDHGNPPKMSVITIDEPAEVLGFAGEIMRKDLAPADMPAHARNTPCDYVIHIHATISHKGGDVIGGGFRNGTVMRALNIYIQSLGG
jgi:predicted DNA-binding protein with PD1-like motif